MRSDSFRVALPRAKIPGRKLVVDFRPPSKANALRATLHLQKRQQGRPALPRAGIYWYGLAKDKENGKRKSWDVDEMGGV